MPLKTKSILAPIEVDDGLRISIMSRHTLNDGKTPDPRITSDLYDEHWTDLAPPLKLVGAYYRGEVKWPEFEISFNDYLLSPEANSALLKLINLVLVQDVVIMCIEKTPERCHRRLVAERCRQINKDLKIIIE